jgi:hypothetical protein
MATVSPPPTYAEVTVTDEVTKKSKFNPLWLKWFLDLAQFLSASGAVSGTVAHNSTSGLQGGTAGQYYHLTLQQETNVANGNFPALSAATVQVTSAAGFHSSDGSTGYTGTVTTASLVGKTITIKDGIITGVA